MQNRAVSLRINSNIISRPFLEVAVAAATSLFLFNTLYPLSPCSVYIINYYANYCKYVLKTLELYLVKYLCRVKLK